MDKDHKEETQFCIWYLFPFGFSTSRSINFNQLILRVAGWRLLRMQDWLVSKQDDTSAWQIGGQFCYRLHLVTNITVWNSIIPSFKVMMLTYKGFYNHLQTRDGAVTWASAAPAAFSCHGCECNTILPKILPDTVSLSLRKDLKIMNYQGQIKLTLITGYH